MRGLITISLREEAMSIAGQVRADEVEMTLDGRLMDDGHAALEAKARDAIMFWDDLLACCMFAGNADIAKQTLARQRNLSEVMRWPIQAYDDIRLH